MTLTETNADAASSAVPSIGGVETFKVAFVIGLAAIADWLFYRHDIGISAAIFLAALGTAAIVANPRLASRRETATALAAMVTGLIPMAIQPSLLATTFGVLGVAFAAVTMTETGTRWSRRLREAGGLIFDTTWRAPLDITRALRKRADKPRNFAALVGWIVPLGLGTIFLLLFATANPLIENFLATIDLSRLTALFNVPRIMLWLLIVALIWPFVFLRHRNALGAMANALVQGDSRTPAVQLRATLLNHAAIFRSLVLFNAMFAVQTVLDLTYLWGSAALPMGMTYASYAHRGAYPLIATALLAAAFVIIALKPGSDTERSRTIRLLVFAWIGQNVLLVSSSILRLDLYVEVFSLSYWRLAAGVWMGLVAIGLILIVARIALGRSNRWLVGMNAAALAVTLYAVSLVNLPAVIASYNVEHSREVSGQGTALDIAYLTSLGPHAIPAMDRYVSGAPVWWSESRKLTGASAALVAQHQARMADWRAWGTFDAGLSRYLEKSRPPQQ